jgi:hypothetical protein
VDKYCEEQGTEICALQISFSNLNIYVLTVYRAPLANFDCFISKLNTILQLLHIPKLHIINGDVNINYILESAQKSPLENLLFSYNLTSIGNFPTRIQNNSATAIDNIFLDISQFENYNITPLLHGLSHHDTQLLTIHFYHSHIPTNKSIVRKINKYTIPYFINELSNKSWDAIFYNEVVNVMFNSFLNTYLRIFYSSFPIIKSYK